MAPNNEETTPPTTILSNIPKSKSPLRICCYGSSSDRTLEHYTKDAYNLGYSLCQKGHTCVNGAGAFGCMGALNKGFEESNGSGKVVGVIHEMFVSDKSPSSWLEGCAPVFSNEGEKSEIHMAKGDDLQERKRMLVDKADALIVMPGGPGTFDEVWEMACARQIGYMKIPIVCVNLDGYYDAFQSILNRAHEDQFLYKHPSEILHFEPDAQSALQWIEDYFEEKGGKIGNKNSQAKKMLRRQPSLLKRMMSVYNLPVGSGSVKSGQTKRKFYSLTSYAVVFSAGIALGMVSKTKR